ncbi:MAG: hypothetical protein QOE65_2810 [Solirubrobacteraceae bacterium]|nr:hypothetical protein [Solirubrobacteraceae bacterium]
MWARRRAVAGGPDGADPGASADRLAPGDSDRGEVTVGDDEGAALLAHRAAEAARGAGEPDAAGAGRPHGRSARGRDVDPAVLAAGVGVSGGEGEPLDDFAAHRPRPPPRRRGAAGQRPADEGERQQRPGRVSCRSSSHPACLPRGGRGKAGRVPVGADACVSRRNAGPKARRGSGRAAARPRATGIARRYAPYRGLTSHGMRGAGVCDARVPRGAERCVSRGTGSRGRACWPGLR